MKSPLRHALLYTGRVGDVVAWSKVQASATEDRYNRRSVGRTFPSGAGLDTGSGLSGSSRDRTTVPFPYLGLPASGRSFTIQAAAVGQTQGGKIKRHAEYWDAGAFLAQLGIPPAPMVQFALTAITDEAIDP